MKKILILLPFLFTSAAFSADHLMIQAGKAFLGNISDGDLKGLQNSRGKFSKKSEIKKKTVKKISISAGDTITFINKDTLTHNVANAGLGISLKQSTGSKDTVKFDKAGKFTVRCAIHPKMKIKITVN